MNVSPGEAFVWKHNRELEALHKHMAAFHVDDAIGYVTRDFNVQGRNNHGHPDPATWREDIYNYLCWVIDTEAVGGEDRRDEAALKSTVEELQRRHFKGGMLCLKKCQTCHERKFPNEFRAEVSQNCKRCEKKASRERQKDKRLAEADRRMQAQLGAQDGD